MKKVSAKIMGTGNEEIKDLELVKGTTKADILRSAGAPTSYEVFRRKTNEFLPDGQDLSQILDDNEKLEVSPPAELGWKLGRSIFSSFFRKQPEKPKLRVVRSYKLSQTDIPRTQTLSPEAKTRSTIQVIPAEKLGLEAELKNLGWHKSGNGFGGKLHCRNREKREGFLRREFGGKYSIHILNPPPHVFSGPHKDCFAHQGGGWYKVHFSKGGNNHPKALINKLESYL